MNADGDELSLALERLYRRHTFGIKFGLHVELALLERLGNPQAGLACIHVGGTNGKGSVCAMVESVLRTAGYRTGRYTSPHLVKFHERIAVNGTPITDAELGALVVEVERAADAVEQALGQVPTFFEVTTAMAFLHFQRAGVKVVVLEVGMGGRLDATNVVTPLLSAITSIGVEHTAYLGPDLETIAGEKAGIIKPGRPVVSGVRESPAREVIRAAAEAAGAPLVEAWEAVGVRVASRGWDGLKLAVETADGEGGTVNLPLLGTYQADNLAVAVAVLESARGMGAVDWTWDDLRKGLAETRWPGRFEVVARNPIMVLDGAHNPPAAERLAETLKQLAPKMPVALVCGFCGDKHARAFLHALGRQVSCAWLVPIASERNMPVAELRQAAAGLSWSVHESSVAEALVEARNWARAAKGMVLVTGSLFLVGEAQVALEAEAQEWAIP
jgi:dihydrofolate synthase/folylpolyglutamate synthase